MLLNIMMKWGSKDMIVYYKLWDMLKRKGISKQDFQKAIGCGSNTMQAMRDNNYVNLKTIDKICEFLECQPGDVIEYLSQK